MSIHSSDTNLHLPVEQDGKRVPVSSTRDFIVALAAVPVWALTVLPLSLAYQLGKRFTYPFFTSSELDRPPLDSGYVAQDVIPRSQRKYDVVVLGATGFTGKLVARHLAVARGAKWAVAGRSRDKLDRVKKELAEELGMDVDVDVLVVDTTIPSTLPLLVRDTRAVITTAGPFSLHGNSVVEFCCKFGTHYADITGEVDWAKAMMDKWEDKAKETGAKIIPFCGHDSIPWDMTVMKLEEALQSIDPEEHLSSVSCSNEICGSASGGTLLTMRESMKGRLAVPPKNNPFERNLFGVAKPASTKVDIPLMFSRTAFPWNKKAAYASPFVMAFINAEVVKWSRSLQDKPSMTYSEYQVVPDFKSAFVGWFGLVGFFSAMLNPITGSIIGKVLPKNGEGPSLDSMQNEYFLSIYAQGTGSKGTKMESIVYFPRCAGYLDTARMVAESALCMALEEDKLPVQIGGFFSPSVGLGSVLFDRIASTGTHFAVKRVD